jgi:hypothetical protein
MGGSVNLQGGGQYQMPNQSTQGYGPRFGGYGGGYGSGYNTPSFGGR